MPNRFYLSNWQNFYKYSLLSVFTSLDVIIIYKYLISEMGILIYGINR